MQPDSLPNQFHQKIIQASAVAVLVVDADLQVQYANPAARRLLSDGQDDDLSGRSVLEVLGADEGKVIQPLCRRALEGKSTDYVNFRLEHPDHRVQQLLLAMNPVTDETDEVWGAAIWILDNTENRRMSEQLAQAEKMASLGTLAGGVAHHFNNILGGVATFVDYALTSGDDTAAKRALQMTAEAAARASKITQSLLSFAKHESLQPDLADLTEVLLTFSHLVERPLHERGIELKLEIKPVPIIAVEANCMHQVLGHLLSNAEEAMPSGGQIRLSLRQDGGEVEIAFADTGEGIDQENIEQVFEPFFTTKGLLAGGQQGNPGLGLSIVHGKVLEMGGTISVESTPGEGTCFRIRFAVPVQRQEPESLPG
ncbi:MAG: two-component system sensor histidine kinase NtrB [Phycisphaerae bacterium]